MTKIAVIGSSSPLEKPMAEFCRQLGQGLVENGFKVITVGRSGVGEHVCFGAIQWANANKRPPEEWLSVPVPRGGRCDFDCANVIQMGGERDRTRKRLANDCEVAIMIGGGGGTRKQKKWLIDSNRFVIPIHGSGGEADRLYSHLAPLPFPPMNDPLLVSVKIDSCIELVLTLSSGGRQVQAWVEDVWKVWVDSVRFRYHEQCHYGHLDGDQRWSRSDCVCDETAIWHLKQALKKGTTYRSEALDSLVYHRERKRRVESS